MFYNKGVLDQWGMVHVCVFVIRDPTPEIQTRFVHVTWIRDPGYHFLMHMVMAPQ
jgi:hypothetical protein